MNPIIVIPARMAATRLPGKPMADILGEPMIVHVWRRAIEAEIGDVVVATDSAGIAEAIRQKGGRAEMTRPDHPSGSDRIHEVLQSIDPEGRHDVVINVQGDLPTIAPAAIRAVLTPLRDPAVDLATLVAEIHREEERTAPSVVKMVGTRLAPEHFRCLYFTRATAPWGDGPLYHHIGLYGWRRSALNRFIALPPSPLEVREKLEQLRALEAGMRIDAIAVADVPLGVDTPADLQRARDLLA
ncbi:3-deoxy-manno-octulosonate cytidylyltransferase [Falsiroseomonas sp.]|uniref:3-deoxy-manno-octulosonate cytidylyltransferase n=1 Tax=Falsiroseomonas sp. TaxID=2870721 RepID=UPI00271C83EA|nr:3-deoxy-manno-octulosonate cytidylyltransferase [Falsiroseomonas sp.]MDO9500124.1 3-deoxy-manno-octulosonate cytidylyltransferase [Falsiroseomonas sp.]